MLIQRFVMRRRDGAAGVRLVVDFAGALHVARALVADIAEEVHVHLLLDVKVVL